MGTDGLYKLDDGDTFPTNCFPVRSFFRQSEEGGGHWLVVHRVVDHERYRVTQPERPAGSQCREQGRSVPSRTGQRQGKSKRGSVNNVLDGNYLMKVHCVEKPSELCSVDVSDRNLHLAKEEDFEAFNNVAYMNASSNLLTLEPFRKFPIIRELELAGNGLHRLQINDGDFPHLEVLDLSYNSLSSQEVLSLGLLPCLRVLHLTGNGLQALPLNMAQPYQAPTQLASNHGLRFYSLEILILDDNKLSSPGIFTSLANLKRLKHLNLDRNGITQVPYLHQIGDSAQDAQLPDLNMQFGVKGHDEAVGGGTSPSMGLDRGGGTCSATAASEGATVERTGYSQCNKECSVQEEPWLTAGVPRTETQREDPAEFQLPLPELQFLSLADNKISEEEALLAVALFPSLSELVIHSNPLTTQKSGDPPLLTGFLQNRLGIKIQRKKTVGPAKPPLVLPVNPKRKVKTRIPKIPKKSLCLEDSLGSLPLSERPADTWKSHMQYKPLPPIQSLSQVNSEESQQAEAVAWVQGEAVHEEATRHEPEEHEKEDNGAAFFMTQVNEPESDAGWHTSLQESEETHRKTQRPKEDSVPDKFRGYEILLDAKPDPDMIEPTGIQQNVRALEYTLQNLLVFRDSRARLDCPQKPYVQKEKKLGKLPPPKPRKSKGDKVEEFLVKIKDTKPISEAPLGNVLQNKEVSRTEYEEARALLREMKRQYRVAQSKVMDQAAQIERDTLGDLEEKRGGK